MSKEIDHTTDSPIMPMPENFKKGKDFVDIKNHGFVEEKIEQEEYVFGASRIPIELLQEDGQWSKFLPVAEIQRKNGLETYNCTNYGTYNCVETLHIRKYVQEVNYAERYGGVWSKIKRGVGGSSQKAAENIRWRGLIPESELPFDDTIDIWSDYYCPDPMTKRLIELGQDWLRKYDFRHEWVFHSKTYNTLEEKQNLLMYNLKRSPIGITVVAWARRNGLYYKYKGTRDNHWCSLVGFVRDKYWIVFDSYDNTIKHLEWNYDFNFAKVYWLSKNPPKWKTRTDGKLDGTVIPKKTWLRFQEWWRWFPQKIGGWFKS